MALASEKLHKYIIIKLIKVQMYKNRQMFIDSSPLSDYTMSISQENPSACFILHLCSKY